MTDRNVLIALAAFAVLLSGLYANRKFDEHKWLVRYGLEDLRDEPCRGDDCAMYQAGRRMASAKEWENGRSCPPEPDALRQGCLSEVADRHAALPPDAQDMEP